jgi:hypothetical protein
MTIEIQEENDPGRVMRALARRRLARGWSRRYPRGMDQTIAAMLGLMSTLSLGGLLNGPAVKPDGLVVAQVPAGEVAQGIPVKEREEPVDDPAADQAATDDDERLPDVQQPDAADQPDVVQPSDDQ